MLPETCVPLQELFDGPLGSASIGRLSAGAETGRDVFLRRIVHQSADELAFEVQAASLVKHPNVLKVLGLAVQEQRYGSLFLVSEFLVGASVMQVAEVARLRGRPLDASVCVRIVHDALVAAADARQILRETSQWFVRRTLFPDTIWVAEFGGTLLSEAGVSQLLEQSYDETPGSSSSPDIPGDADVVAARKIAQLLLSDREGKWTLPANHAGLAAILGASAEVDSFRDPREMAHALAALPDGFMAPEEEVGSAVQSLMWSELVRQRNQLGLRSDSKPVAAGDDATQVFSPGDMVERTERPTLRPPGPDGTRDHGSDRPSRDVTRVMDASQAPKRGTDRTPGANAPDFTGSAGETTQMFVPVFGIRGPEGTRPAGLTESKDFGETEIIPVAPPFFAVEPGATKSSPAAPFARALESPPPEADEPGEPLSADPIVFDVHAKGPWRFAALALVALAIAGMVLWWRSTL